MCLIQKFLHRFTSQIIVGQIYQHQMIIRAPGYNLDIPGLQTLAQCLCIISHILHICLKVIRQGFFKTYRFRCYHMHERPTLDPRENCLVKVILISHFLAGHNHTATGSTQCLVGCCGSHMRIRNRTWMKSCGHKTCDMGNIHH